jgi:hypothetical protein
MKAKLLALFVALLMVGCGESSTSSAGSKSLSESEVLEIKQELDSMFTMVQRGDFSFLFEKTHEAAHDLSGGRENFEAEALEGLKVLAETEVKFLGFEIGTPTRLYPAGKYELCFVPKIQTFVIKEQKYRGTGFMIAARTVGEKEWKYLDGEILREARQDGFQSYDISDLFPNIDPDIEMPPNKLERL